MKGARFEGLESTRTAGADLSGSFGASRRKDCPVKNGGKVRSNVGLPACSMIMGHGGNFKFTGMCGCVLHECKFG